MKRAEFIKLWADLIAEGRRRHYPNIRPSEEALSRMYDEKSAGKHWQKWRVNFAPLTVPQARELLNTHHQSKEALEEEVN